MGRKIFISYKYGDNNVYGWNRTVRDYVDDLQDALDHEDHVNKGELDNTDLRQLNDDTIRQKLADRIFDSTVTIVLISPNMKEPLRREREQWIPWEIRYSLRTENREVGKSYPNAMVAVVLPDHNNSYSYYFNNDACTVCNYTLHKTNQLFSILENNMFNIKPHKADLNSCSSSHDDTHSGDSSPSYIESATWDDFRTDIDYHIEEALERQRNRDDYIINTQLEW